MQLKLRIKEGGWGDGCLDNMGTVAASVIGALTSGLPSDVRFDILLEQNEQPCALKTPSELGEYVIHVAGPALKWFKLTYELGHEFTHVMADAWSWDEKDPFRWFEEVLADAGSLFALRSLAASWQHQPPRPGWQVNCNNFWKYFAEYLAGPGRSLDDGVDFKQWLANELPLLKVEDAQRPRFTIIARHLLPIFETDPTAWRAVRYLHQFDRPEGMTFAEFLKEWRDNCPAESQSTVDSIAEILGVSYPAQRAQRARALQYVAALKAAVSRPAATLRGTPDPDRPAPQTTKRPGPSTE